MSTSERLERSKQYCMSKMQGKMKYAKPDYAIEAPEKCDLCRRTIAEMDFYADAVIPGCHQWGFICQQCIEAEELSFSPENGLLFQKQANAKPNMEWLVVAGRIDEPNDCVNPLYNEDGTLYGYINESGKLIILGEHKYNDKYQDDDEQ